MSRPRLTNAELRYLLDALFFKKEGRCDSKTKRWVYPSELRVKLARILRARKRS